MATSSFRLSKEASSAAADAVTRLLDGGRLRLYSDSPQPATADAPVPGRAILLVDLALGSPAFEPAVAGNAEATEIKSSRATGRGTAEWFRAVTSGGRAIYDGSVGEDNSGADCELGSTMISPGVEVLVSSMIYTQPKARA